MPVYGEILVTYPLDPPRAFAAALLRADGDAPHQEVQLAAEAVPEGGVEERRSQRRPGGRETQPLRPEGEADQSETGASTAVVTAAPKRGPLASMSMNQAFRMAKT